MAEFCCKNQKISVAVYLLVGLFGIGSWLAINGLWVELPILVARLPEGWDLPSYLVVIIQLANIGPIAYAVANKFSNGKVGEVSVVYIIVTVGALACLLLAIFWDRVTLIGGVDHSTALLVLAFSLALVDCTSSVVFLPYMAVFKPEYMTALYIGEGFSGLLPSLVALIQGVGGNGDCVNVTVPVDVNGTNATTSKLVPVAVEPLFTVEVFFFFLFAMMLLCGGAFTCLNYLPYCRREHAKLKVYLENVDDADDKRAVEFRKRHRRSSCCPSSGEPRQTESTEDVIIHDTENSAVRLCPDDDADRNQNESGPLPLTKYQYVYLLVLNSWINALGNGLLPSIQSYSCLPYGIMTYHLAVTLASVSNPVACFVAFLSPTKSKKVVQILTYSSTAVAAYIVYTAATSPHPPLLDNVGGQILVVACWILVTSIFSYTKATIACIFRNEGRKALLYCGGTTQAGSAVGALVAFLLVNIFHLFVSLPPCST
ncbi:solute carrier family 52, riboflavin transporter, member 3-B-like [Tubulanus polymorphus]|uniref:solute carrier family 52, riboflavin transporter, member 3-B-like n=1 Tax=Tubulanus polymorphus TaxID=672921 RepID=UPI003DA42B84